MIQSPLSAIGSGVHTSQRLNLPLFHASVRWPHLAEWAVENWLAPVTDAHFPTPPTPLLASPDGDPRRAPMEAVGVVLRYPNTYGSKRSPTMH